MASVKHFHPNQLSDSALEDCFDGSTSLEMVRNIFTKKEVINADNTVEPEEFAYWFQKALEGFAGDDEANETNFEWGESIAENINNATKM